MRTLINGNEVDVRFWREKVVLQRNADRTLSFRPLTNDENEIVHFGKTLKRMSIRTHCFISDIDNTKSGKDRFSLVAEGTCTRSTIDTDNKWMGKQVALHRSLMKLVSKDAWQLANDILLEDAYELPHTKVTGFLHS